MAKSKNGGTRAYIRGRIGSDVYSIGKNGKGDRQQVVRSLAESVANPRTAAQMSGRMFMSTIMQAVSAMAGIIDHSFDGYPKGQPSISEFIRLNYALVKADAEAHPASGNFFALSAYQQKGVKIGKYIISKGSAVVPAAVSCSDEFLTIALTAGTLTVGGLKTALGISGDEYITAVVLDTKNNFRFIRIKVTTTLSDSTAITDDNVASLFSVEGNTTAVISLSTNNILFSIEGVITTSGTANGVIISKRDNGAWIHSNCQLSMESSAGADMYDTQLPTYPTGTEQFLNGGDL